MRPFCTNALVCFYALVGTSIKGFMAARIPQISDHAIFGSALLPYSKGPSPQRVSFRSPAPQGRTHLAVPEESCFMSILTPKRVLGTFIGGSFPNL